MSGWTDERVALLTKLFHEGRTGEQIAAEIGSGRTRGSVMGKLHRLGLKRRDLVESPVPQPALAPAVIPPVASAREDRRRFRHLADRVAVKAAAVAPLEPLIDPAPTRERFECLGDALLALPAGPRCRWPMDIDDRADVRFCGARATHGSVKGSPHPYCAGHHVRSRTPGARGERHPARITAAA